MKKFFFIMAMVIAFSFNSEAFSANLAGKTEVSEEKVQKLFQKEADGLPDMDESASAITGYDLYQSVVKCLNGSNPLYFSVVYEEKRFSSLVWEEFEAEAKNAGTIRVRLGEDNDGEKLVYISNQ